MNKQYENFLKILNTGLTGNIHALEKPDFEKLVRLSYEQSVVPIFLEGLVRYDNEYSIPVSHKIKLLEISSACIAGQTQKTAEFCSLYKKMTDEGISPVVLKGLICRIAYGKFENHRASGDEDIYIKKEDFSACRKVLEQNGYSIKNNIAVTDKVLKNIHTINFESENSSLIIEVHLDYIGRQTKIQKSLDDVFNSMKDDIIQVDYCGEKYYTLSYTYNYIYLFLHYLKHFMSSGAGIRHIMDLAVFGEKNKEKIDFSFAEKEISKYIKGSFYADTLEIMKMLGYSFDTAFKKKNPKLLCGDLLNGGTFGFNNPENIYASTYTSIKGSGRRFAMIRFAFPSFSAMADVFPVLYIKPWLLPVYYFKRIINYFKKKRNPELEKKSIKKGKERAKLINGYIIK